MAHTKYKTRAEAANALRARQARYMRERYQRAAATVPVVTLDAEHKAYLDAIVARTGAAGPTAAVRAALRIAAAADSSTKYIEPGAPAAAPAPAPAQVAAHTLPQGIYDAITDPANVWNGAGDRDEALIAVAKAVRTVIDATGLAMLRDDERQGTAAEAAAARRASAGLCAALGGEKYVDAVIAWSDARSTRDARGRRKKRENAAPPPLPGARSD